MAAQAGFGSSRSPKRLQMGGEDGRSRGFSRSAPSCLHLTVTTQNELLEQPCFTVCNAFGAGSGADRMSEQYLENRPYEKNTLAPT